LGGWAGGGAILALVSMHNGYRDDGRGVGEGADLNARTGGMT
jgi:hypothetical protein